MKIWRSEAFPLEIRASRGECDMLVSPVKEWRLSLIDKRRSTSHLIGEKNYINMYLLAVYTVYHYIVLPQGSKVHILLYSEEVRMGTYVVVTCNVSSHIHVLGV